MRTERITGSASTNSRPPGTSPVEEIALLRRIGAGDVIAFEAFYRAYLPRLARFLRRLVRRPHAVEEILNDTMLAVWRTADAFRGHSKVSTWVFSIAYHKALTVLSRLDDPVDSDRELLESDQLGPDGHLQQEQRTALLWGVIDKMSAEHRAVIELTYYHGYTYQEIAQISGCPINTVKTRMYHARKRLQSVLSQREPEFR